MKNYFFVYGTLMAYSGRMYGFSKDASFVTKMTLANHDIYSLGGFPGIKPGAGVVHGELWEVPKESIPVLDRYESEGYLYLRRNVGEYNGVPIQAYIYNNDIDPRFRINSGSWLDRTN